MSSEVVLWELSKGRGVEFSVALFLKAAESSITVFSRALGRGGGRVVLDWIGASIGLSSVCELFVLSPNGAIWRRDTVVSRPLLSRT